jgi:hypothetical protein
VVSAPALQTKILTGDVPLRFATHLRQLLWSPSLLSTASPADCERLQKEFREQLQPVLDECNVGDLLFWTADQQEYKHFLDLMENNWRQLELLITSRKHAVEQLLAQVPAAEDAESFSAWEAGEPARQLQRAQGRLEIWCRRNTTADVHEFCVGGGRECRRRAQRHAEEPVARLRRACGGRPLGSQRLHSSQFVSFVQ